MRSDGLPTTIAPYLDRRQPYQDRLHSASLPAWGQSPTASIERAWGQSPVASFGRIAIIPSPHIWEPHGCVRTMPLDSDPKRAVFTHIGDGRRIITSSGDAVAFVPHFACYERHGA